MNDAPLLTWMSANWLSGRCWPSGVAIRMFLIASMFCAERLLQADDEIEGPLALDHLRRRRAAHRGLDQRVDVADVQAVPRDLRAVGLDRSGSAVRARGPA